MSMTKDVEPKAPAGTFQDSLELERVLDAWHLATDRLQRTHETLRDEVGRLTNELERKNRELARKNRLADLGLMASHVAHEVRNELAPMKLYLNLLRRRRDASSQPQTMDKIEAGFFALEAIVNDLLNFTSEREPVLSRFDAAELTREVCQSLQAQLDTHRIAVEFDLPLKLFVLADREMLRRALLNLARNALEAMPQGGELLITGIDSPSSIELEIADSGPGVMAAQRERLFEPFFTTKREGTGLGLAIVHRIAEAHGGDVNVSNCPQGGAAFTISIPKRAMEAAA